MPFAWRDSRSGQVMLKLIQGGSEFLPWPIADQEQREREEGIPEDSTIIDARSYWEAWRLLIERCQREQRMRQDTLGDAAHEHKVLSRKRKAGGGNSKGQDESERDGTEQGLRDLISSLPHELVVHKVLPCLPLPKIFELQCVSREWKSLLSSPYFVHQCIEAQQGHQAWLVMAGRAPGPNPYAKEFIAYVPSLGRWIPFPLPHSPPISTLLGCHAELLQECVKLHDQHSPSNFLMTSAGGLICCIVFNVPLDLYVRNLKAGGAPGAPNYTILVFNPLTGHMKTLPPFSAGDIDCFSVRLYMLYDQVHDTYKILVSSRRSTIYIYDSKSGSWKITSPHPSSSMGILNADLFFYVREGPVCTLQGYHMESDAWSSLIVPAPPFFESLNGGFFLKKLNGRVILAYDFRPAAAPVDLQGFTVWELNYSSTSSSAAVWVQMARPPPKFWNRFHDVFTLGDLENDTSFIDSGRLLCMTVADFKDSNYGGNYSTPLVYDLDLKLWYRLPPYKGNKRFMGLFSFHPTLNAPM